MALAIKSDFIILDEPMSSLTQNKATVLSLLKELIKYEIQFNNLSFSRGDSSNSDNVII